MAKTNEDIQEELNALSYRELQSKAKSLNIAANGKKEKLVSSIYELLLSETSEVSPLVMAEEKSAGTEESVVEETIVVEEETPAAEDVPVTEEDMSSIYELLKFETLDVSPLIMAEEQSSGTEEIVVEEETPAAEDAPVTEDEKEMVPVDTASTVPSDTINSTEETTEEEEGQDDEEEAWCFEDGEEDILVQYLMEEEERNEALTQEFTGLPLTGLPTPNAKKTIFSTTPKTQDKSKFKIDWGFEVQSPLAAEEVAVEAVEGEVEEGGYEDYNEEEYEEAACTTFPEFSGKQMFFASPQLNMGKGVHWTYESYDETQGVTFQNDDKENMLTPNRTPARATATSTSSKKPPSGVVQTSPYRHRNKVLINGVKTASKVVGIKAWNSSMKTTSASPTKQPHTTGKPSKRSSMGGNSAERNEKLMGFWLSKSGRSKSFSGKSVRTDRVIETNLNPLI